MRADLTYNGGALARLDDRFVGCMRLATGPDGLHVRRLAVEPAFQGRGVGRALMAWAEAEARRRGYGEVRLGVRLALPRLLEFYRRLGYEIEAEHAHPGYRQPTWVSLRKSLD